MLNLSEDNYYVILKAKHDRINKALDRLDVLLMKYMQVLEDCRKTNTKWKDFYDWDFNLLYDLRDRLEERLFQNYKLVGDWNWKVHGLNIIDIG
jgi:uncharacterized NAD(P)/FAD-binding protein YdhS